MPLVTDRDRHTTAYSWSSRSDGDRWHGGRVRVLVVGGTGFLGAEVVTELLRRGHRATVLSRRPPAAPPPGVDVRTADALSADEGQWAALLAGHDGAVFAAGADDRTTPRAPAQAYFDRGNVAPVTRLLAAAAGAGCTRAVILGSYFATVDRERPDLRMAARHPYVRSRVEQARAARAAAGPGLPVAVLEIPFVFGDPPGGRSLWTPMLPWLRSAWPLVAPPGGTAVVPVRAVAEAAVGALERAAGGDYPVAEANLTWADLIGRLALAAGRPGKVRVRRLPAGVFNAAIQSSRVVRRLRGEEPGLDPRYLAQALTSELYLDPAICRGVLGVRPGGLDEAIRATVTARRPPG
jgi:nucleoside-diphosphate-sugar epimerase